MIKTLIKIIRTSGAADSDIEGAHMQNKRGLRVMVTIILLQRGNTQANLPYFPFLAETG
jgi:hypothetical protein